MQGPPASGVCRYIYIYSDVSTIFIKLVGKLMKIFLEGFDTIFLVNRNMIIIATCLNHVILNTMAFVITELGFSLVFASTADFSVTFYCIAFPCNIYIAISPVKPTTNISCVGVCERTGSNTHAQTKGPVKN